MRDKITAIMAQVAGITAAANTRPQGREDFERLAKLAATVSELEGEVWELENQLDAAERELDSARDLLDDQGYEDPKEVRARELAKWEQLFGGRQATAPKPPVFV